ncbi:XrtA/PEP-CTERM system TPR-repeat protein PrsT [Inhella inkyongensis]|nr:XrtA/PEP-CTERM system TPR-repeat protein PrsT [Inhella inkyongensis]
MNLPRLRLLAASLATAGALSACLSPSSEELMARAKDQMRQGAWQTAAIDLKSALQQDGSLIEARVLLATALVELGDGTGAWIELEKLPEGQIPRERLAPLQARAMVAKGEMRQVIERFGSAQFSDPQAAASLEVSLARAYFALGDVAKGLTATRKALGHEPQRLEARLLEARAMAATNEVDTAVSRAQAILNEHPKNLKVLLLLGDLEAIRPQGSQAAMAHYLAAQAIAPTDLESFSRILPIQLKERQLDKAKLQLEAMRKAAPTHPNTQYYVAWLAFENKEYEAAALAIEQVLKQVFDSADVHQLAGLIDLQRKRHTRATDHLRRAVNLSPQNQAARLSLAQALLQSGDASGTLNALQPLINQQQPAAQARLLAAQAHTQLGQGAQAERILLALKAQEPDFAAGRVALGITLAQNSKTAQGLEELRRLAAAENDPQGDMALIGLLNRLDRLEEAIQAVDALEKKLSKDPLPQLLRGQFLTRKGDSAAATQAFSKALERESAYLPAVHGLVNLDLLAKKPADAQARLEKFTREHPKSAAAWFSLLQVRQSQGAKIDEQKQLLNKALSAEPQHLPAHLELTKILREQKDNAGAMAAVKTALSRLPEQPQLLEHLALLHEDAGDFNQAAAVLNQWIGAFPKDAKAYALLAGIQLRQGDKTAPLATLRKGFETSPESIPIAKLLVSSEITAGNRERARTVAQAVQRRHPASPEGHLLEGDIAFQAKDYTKAAAAYRKGWEIDAGAGMAVRLHRSLLLAKRGVEATTFEATHQARAPGDLYFQLYLADLAFAERRWDVAETHYRRALAIDPKRAGAQNNLALALDQAGKAGALAAAEAAASLEPERAEILDTLATLLAKEGQIERAIKTQEKALRLAPGAAPHQLTHAKLLIQAKRGAEARAVLQQLAGLGARFPHQDEVARLLRNL